MGKLKSFVQSLFSCFKYDVRYLKNYRHYRRKSLTRSAVAKDLIDQGFVVLPNFVSPEECDRLRSEVAEILDKQTIAPNSRLKLENGLSISRRDGFGKKANENSGTMFFVAYLESLLDTAGYAENELISGVIKEACHQPLSFINTAVYANFGLTDSRCYHFDSVANSQFKSFLYLTDAGLDSGPYSYVKGSHQVSLLRYLNMGISFLLQRPTTDCLLYRRKKAEHFTVKKGTLVISNQRGLHRGLPQSKGFERWLLVNNYSHLPSSKPTERTSTSIAAY